jgi:ubiquinone/menaquinone biosynthesis C-methylase UbiE
MSPPALRPATLLHALYARLLPLLYNKFAWAYDAVAWGVSAGRWAQWRRIGLDAARGGKILELGFGTGALLGEGTRRGRAMTGLELSPAMHRIAAGRLARAGLPGVPRVQADACSMPFAPVAFDAVLATFPAPYILDPATLAECARVLRPEGRLVIVGMWVRPRAAWLRRLLPLFYGTLDTAVFCAIEARLRAAGFALTRRDVRCGWADVGLIVASPVVVGSDG